AGTSRASWPPCWIRAWAARPARPTGTWSPGRSDRSDIAPDRVRDGMRSGAMRHLEMAARALRIAHVTFGLDVGGQEQLLLEVARHADRERFALRFLSIGDRGPLAGDIEALGWPVDALGVPSGLRPGLIARLAASFRRWRPDAVHTHDQRALFYAGPA